LTNLILFGVVNRVVLYFIALSGEGAGNCF
jgi:hypothetical protein